MREQDSWAECAAKAVAAWTFPDPKGKIVKAALHGHGGHAHFPHHDLDRSIDRRVSWRAPAERRRR
jgi:hypothetical protein